MLDIHNAAWHSSICCASLSTFDFWYNLTGDECRFDIMSILSKSTSCSSKGALEKTDIIIIIIIIIIKILVVDIIIIIIIIRITSIIMRIIANLVIIIIMVTVIIIIIVATIRYVSRINVLQRILYILAVHSFMSFTLVIAKGSYVWLDSDTKMTYKYSSNNHNRDESTMRYQMSS